MSIPTVLDRFTAPQCAKLLGLDILEVDPVTRQVRIALDGKHAFCNAAGSIQGGFLTAMLDDCMGPAVVIGTDAAFYPTTISLNVSFLAPAKPGRLVGEAWIVQLGKTIGFIESELRDGAGIVVARATASVRVVPTAKAVAMNTGAFSPSP